MTLLPTLSTLHLIVSRKVGCFPFLLSMLVSLRPDGYLASAAFILPPVNGNLQSCPPLHVVVTISGNSATAAQHNQGTSSEGRSNRHPSDSAPPRLESLHHIIIPGPDEKSNLEAARNAEMAEGSGSTIEPNPQLMPRMNQLPTQEALVGADTAAHLASILSNLEQIIGMTNLQADVSNSSYLLVTSRL